MSYICWFTVLQNLRTNQQKTMQLELVGAASFDSWSQKSVLPQFLVLAQEYSQVAPPAIQRPPPSLLFPEPWLINLAYSSNTGARNMLKGGKSKWRSQIPNNHTLFMLALSMLRQLFQHCWIYRASTLDTSIQRVGRLTGPKTMSIVQLDTERHISLQEAIVSCKKHLSCHKRTTHSRGYIRHNYYNCWPQSVTLRPQTLWNEGWIGQNLLHILIRVVYRTLTVVISSWTRDRRHSSNGIKLSSSNMLKIPTRSSIASPPNPNWHVSFTTQPVG